VAAVRAGSDAPALKGDAVMKITDVNVTLFAWDDIPTTQYGRHTARFAGRSDLGLVAVESDQGVVGHAFLGASSRPASRDAKLVIEALKPLLLGQHPLDRELLFERMWQRGRRDALRALGAVDVALWDLAGKLSGLPVCRLIGGYRRSVPAYASSAVLASPEAYVEESLSFRERGWTAYKIHPPAEWETDIRICAAVRKAVGEGYRLMLDSTWSYQYPEALRVGHAIEDLGFYWYEDPLMEDDLTNCAKLRQKLGIPLLATEYAPGGHTAFAPWLMAQATDYLRGDVAVKGGLSGCLKAAHLAECFHMNFEVHHGGNSLNNFANLHLIAAIRNCEYFEVLLPAGAQKYGLRQDIEVDRQGLVHVPDRPGLGAEIDFDLIKRKEIAVLR
jgi:L-alanine-DL-glutamate epimerase-like enolase superfamily enzyme